MVILVAEHDDSSRIGLRRLLTEAGFHVVVAATAAEAMKHADEEGRVDVLLTDLNLPDTRGDELAEILARKMPTVSVIYTSTLPPPSKPAIRGAFFEKPIEVDRLIDLVTRIQRERAPHTR